MEYHLMADIVVKIKIVRFMDTFMYIVGHTGHVTMK